MSLNGAFTVLLLLLSGVSAGIVLPPTNVTLNCSNPHVTVSWEYSQPHPQTRFRVHISGTAWDYENETTEHHYDLSHFVWASEERYMDLHYVTVTAIEGGNQSEPMKPISFTFNDLKLADTKCSLDFPPAYVIEKDSMATVTFMNPFIFYRELQQAVKPDTASFKFTVTSDAGDSSGSCSLQQDNCKLHDISFPDDVEKCVSLTGRLFAGNNVGEVVFRKIERICAPTETFHALMLTLLLFVLAIIITVIIILICMVKAWKTTSTPNPVITLVPDNKGLRYAPVSPIDISFATVVDNKTCKNPSVSSEEDDNLQDSSAAAGFDSRPPASSYAEGALSDGCSRNDDSADDSVKTETISIDLEEDVSPYDCPHTLQVDMGDGDMVTCYTHYKRT